MSSEKTKPVQIKAVLVDIHGTLFTPRGVKKSNLLARAIHLATEINVAGNEARQVLNEVRARLHKTRRGVFLNSRRYWVKTNQEMLRRLGHEITESQAHHIHILLISEKFYKVHPMRREFIRWLLRTKFESAAHVAVVSNATVGVVEEALRTENIYGWFGDIYTPDRLLASKPAPLFWHRVLAEMKVTPNETLMIGNSVLNDASAAQAGIHTVLILDRFDADPVRKKEIRLRLKEYATDGVRVIASERLPSIRFFIDRNFCSART